MIGGNRELNNYILKVEAYGISHTVINVIAFIGMFIFGWLILTVFEFLGKIKLGLAYFIPLFISFFVGVLFEPALMVLALIIYIAAWVHANVILSRYQSAARQRIAEIERQSEIGIDTVLEKGLLLGKVLGKRHLAVDVLTDALRMPGGDPFLLNSAGFAMFVSKRYKEAAEFLDRALASAKDETLIKQIKKTRRSVEKKIA